MSDLQWTSNTTKRINLPNLQTSSWNRTPTLRGRLFEDESKYRSCGRNRIISCSKHLYPLNPCNVFAQGTNILPLGLIICRFSSGLEIFDTWACWPQVLTWQLQSSRNQWWMQWMTVVAFSKQEASTSLHLATSVDLQKSFAEAAPPQNRSVVGKVPQGQQATHWKRQNFNLLPLLMIAFKKYIQEMICEMLCLSSCLQ